MPVTVSIYDLHEKVNAFMDAYKMLMEAQELQKADALTPDEWEDINVEVGQAVHSLYEFFDGHQHQLGVTNGGYPVIMLYPDDIWQEVNGQGLGEKKAKRLMERLTEPQIEAWAEELRTDEDIYEPYVAKLTELVANWLKEQK